VLLIGGGAVGATTAAAFVSAVLAIFGFSGVVVTNQQLGKNMPDPDKPTTNSNLD